VAANTKEKQVIGVDLGGTAIKLGRYTATGTCITQGTVATPQPSTPEAVTAAIAAAVAEVDPDRQAGAIGVGTPGPSDGAGRRVQVAINLAGWRDVPLADALEAQVQRPVILANDANCAGLGEVWLGAGQQLSRCGGHHPGHRGRCGAVILNGELFVGRLGTAAEPGLITLNPDGPPCNSGNQGSLEQYCSVQAVRREMGCEPGEVAARAAQGDAAAIAYWQRYGRYLGAGLTSLIYLLTPEAIILGGGISAGAEWFLPSALAEIERRVLPTSRSGLVVRLAELGNQAGVVGAARLALQTYGT
jgi:glucokinase